MGNDNQAVKTSKQKSHSPNCSVNRPDFLRQFGSKTLLVIRRVKYLSMQTLLTEGFRLGSKSKDPGANQQPTLPLLSSPVRASRTHSVDTDAGFVVVWGKVTLSELQTLTLQHWPKSRQRLRSRSLRGRLWLRLLYIYLLKRICGGSTYSESLKNPLQVKQDQPLHPDPCSLIIFSLLS